MPTFQYVVKNAAGKNLQGIQEAPDLNALVSGLRTQGYIIIRINEVAKTSIFNIKLGAGSGGPGGKGGGIKLEDLVVFTRQMATLVAAGIPLIQAIDILAEQAEKQKFKTILQSMHQEIQGGKSFSDALNKHKKIFSELFVNLVKAGESSGSLEEVLDRLATYLEKTNALQKKVKSALMYPATVSAMAFLITYGMLSFVIPKFAVMFDGLNAKLPTLTVMLIQLSHFLADFWWLVFGGITGVCFLCRQAVAIPAGRLLWDSTKLRFWIFGPLILKVSISKFARTLATLIKSGVPIIQSLDIVAKTSGNRKIELVIRDLTDSVKKGETLSGPLGKSKVFPPMVVRMIHIGEETGELEEMLKKIADFYDSEVDSAISGLTSLIEPFIIAFLGIVIGGIVVAMFLPILTLAGQIL
jgi:type IV pilus assembly protein PilC